MGKYFEKTALKTSTYVSALEKLHGPETLSKALDEVHSLKDVDVSSTSIKELINHIYSNGKSSDITNKVDKELIQTTIKKYFKK